MKLIFTVMILSLQFSIYAQNTALTQDPVTRPELSIRCKELHEQKNAKVKNQQRLNALLQRNQSLMKKTPEEKELMRAKLKANQIKIKNELYLTNLNIESTEERIIRSGCPGIAL